MVVMGLKTASTPQNRNNLLSSSNIPSVFVAVAQNIKAACWNTISNVAVDGVNHHKQNLWNQ